MWRYICICIQCVYEYSVCMNLVLENYFIDFGFLFNLLDANYVVQLRKDPGCSLYIVIPLQMETAEKCSLWSRAGEAPWSAAQRLRYFTEFLPFYCWYDVGRKGRRRAVGKIAVGESEITEVHGLYFERRMHTFMHGLGFFFLQIAHVPAQSEA